MRDEYMEGKVFCRKLNVYMVQSDDRTSRESQEIHAGVVSLLYWHLKRNVTATVLKFKH
jgi:hypothetical protein